MIHHHRIVSAMSAFLPCAVLLLAAPPAGAQPASSRLEGQRYEALTGLAEYVTEGADFVLEEATGTLVRPGTRERALITALTDFSRQAKSFQDRLSGYPTRPWRLDTDVSRLRTAARRVQLRLKRVTAMRDTFEDWTMVIEDVDDMQKVLRGERVDLRPPDPEWTDDDQGHHGGADDTGMGALQGQRLADFRRLAQELDDQAQRAFDVARAMRADRSERGQQLLQDLEHFAEQTASVRTRTDDGEVRPREIGPIVSHLLEDARKADTSMRSARVYQDVWDEWALVIRSLEAMAPLMR